MVHCLMPTQPGPHEIYRQQSVPSAFVSSSLLLVTFRFIVMTLPYLLWRVTFAWKSNFICFILGAYFSMNIKNDFVNNDNNGNGGGGGGGDSSGGNDDDNDDDVFSETELQVSRVFNSRMSKRGSSPFNIL